MQKASSFSSSSDRHERYREDSHCARRRVRLRSRQLGRARSAEPEVRDHPQLRSVPSGPESNLLRRATKKLAADSQLLRRSAG